MPSHAEMGVVWYGGWIVSKVQSLFWRRVTSLRKGVVLTEGGAFHLEDITFCGGVCFVLEEGVLLIWSRGSYIQRNNCMCCNLYMYKIKCELIAKYPSFIERI